MASLSSFIAGLLGLSGCGKPSSQPIAVDHDQLYRQGVALIQPYMALHGIQAKSLGKKDREKLNSGILLLTDVTKINPENWAAFWIIGKGHQALGEHEQACDAFGKAFQIQKKNPDVAREYMIECLEIGRANEAVDAAQHGVQLQPDNAGLRANLALALLMNGQLDEALQAADASLKIAPDDTITQGVRRRIIEVKNGTRSQPKTIRELEK